MADHSDTTEVVRKPISQEISGVLDPGESIAGNTPGLVAFLNRTAPAGKWVSYRVRVHGVVSDTDPRVRPTP